MKLKAIKLLLRAAYLIVGQRQFCSLVKSVTVEETMSLKFLENEFVNLSVD